MAVRRGIPVAGMLSLGLIVGYPIAAEPSIAAGEGAGSFESQLGWWSGTGRLKFKDGKREAVKCRATSRWDDAGGNLLQAVRCASASGKVDIKSETQEVGVSSRVLGANEPTSSKATSLAKLSKGGFPVSVSGTDIKAKMTVFVKGKRQIVEVQFLDNELIGLSIIFEKG